MAVPTTFTTRDISGRFQQNKSLSDDIDEILSLQGVGWITRKVIKAANATLTIKHYTAADGVEHIDVQATFSGGIPGSTETRIMDWQEREKADGIFGPAIGKSRRASVDEMTEEYLKKGLTDDAKEFGVPNMVAKSDTPKTGKTWTSEQVWGTEEVDGIKRFTRRIFFIGGKGEKLTARIVYDDLFPT